MFSSRYLRRVAAASVAVGAVSASGVVGAGFGDYFTGGTDAQRRGSTAEISCPGGMARHGHVFSEDASVFPGDPAPVIDIVFTAEDDGYLVEEILTGTHTSTHLDAPGHFIPGARTVDELAANEFVWPVYVIDVRDRVADDPDFQLSSNEIRRYERTNGKIPRGAMVVIQTGFEAFFGTDAYLDIAPGFSGEAVQWMFDNRWIKGTGSDTFGPDATSDELFDATYTTLLNDGVALPGLRNLDALNVTGDILIATAVALENGSGYQVDPISCLERRRDR